MHDSTSNLCNICDLDWISKHKPIMHAACRRLPDDSKKKKTKPPCYEIGLCLCDEAGMSLYFMRNSFLAYMKKTAARGTMHRSLLKMGYLVVHLVGSSAEVVDDADKALCELLGERTSAHREEIFYHLSYVSLSPIEPSFTPMRKILVQPDPDEIHLQATEC